MKRFALLFLFLINCSGRAQSISDTFFYPDIDSLLWLSPLSPRKVVQEGIREIEMRIGKWNRECKACCFATKERSTYFYTNTSRIYTYDSLGFPIKIVLKEDSGKKEYTYKCINTYNDKKQLVKAMLCYWDKKTDSLHMNGTITREYYDNGGGLRQSQVYMSNLKELRRREYIYSLQGTIELFYEYWPAENLTRAEKFFYDSTSNRLAGKAILRDRSDESAEEAKTPQLFFLYDRSGQNMATYYVGSTEAYVAPDCIQLGPNATGIIVTRNYRKRRKRELERAQEIKDGKKYNWTYYYRFKRFNTICEVSDHKTGLPLYTINSYNPYQQHRYVHRIIHYKWVKIPRDPLLIKFPAQHNVTEYFYVRWKT